MTIEWGLGLLGYVVFEIKMFGDWVSVQVFMKKFFKRNIVKQLGYSYFSPLDSAKGYSADGMLTDNK